MMTSGSPASRSRSLRNAAGYALSWLPVAVLALYMKWVMLSQMGYLVVARSLGRDVGALTWLERASLYREDILLGFVLVPALLTVVFRLLPRRLRAPTSLTVSLMALVFLFINLLTYANVGRFMSPHMAGDGVQWVLQNPAYLVLYVSRAALLKFTVLATAAPALALLAHRLDQTGQGSRDSGMKGGHWLLAGVVTTLLLMPPLRGVRLPGGYAASVLRQTGTSALDLDRPVHTIMVDTPEALRQAYREVANLPPYRRSQELFGALADFDVVFVVLETAPSQVLDFSGDSLREFPSIRRLLDGSLVATRHHTTYPYTHSALFSLFSGCYPTGLSIGVARDEMFSDAPIARLASMGYQTAIYSPSQSQFTADQLLFPALGFQRYVVVGDSNARRSAPRLERMAAGDRAALERMKADMTGWLREGRRFAVAFLPQLSHGPWPEVDSAGSDIRARGRAILAREDAWIGELISLLERYGRLDHTLIVITGDHGLRTREEYPALPPGQIDDISFRVPLLLHAPKAFGDGVIVDRLTSHLDIAPTLLDLLGVPGDREVFQGLPLWDERLEQRRTFFLAREYLGADGLHDDAGFYMHNDFLGVDYAAPQLHFGRANLLRADDERARDGREQLATLRALQNHWIEVIAKLQRTAGGL
jgi:hypothetical protein